MSNTMDVNDFLDACAGVLIRCFIIGAVLLAIFFVVMVFCSPFAYQIHSQWVDLTKQQFDLLWYCGLGFMKLWIIVEFLLPYIAIRLVLAKRTRNME